MTGRSKTHPLEEKADLATSLPPGKARSASDGGVLREKARNLILARIVPDRPPDRMWGGAGVGVPCVICSASVTRDQVGLEIEYTQGVERSNYHAHVPCYAALESERHQLRLSRPAFAINEPAPADGPLKDA